MTALTDRLRSLLDDALEAYRGTEGEAALRAARERIDQPLRVAIAGRVKAGKSTLLNALMGERIAPTDAGECTRIVTWYRDGHTSRVTLDLDGGATLPGAFRRDGGGAIEVDLAGHAPTAVKRMVVDWPSRRLAHMTLIDTPGIASITTEASARTIEFLAHDDDDPGEADAVIYLLRHVHADDVRFLEAFHDRELAQPTPVNALGVLSRADEIGVCRLDALESATRIAARLSADPRIRRLCQTVIPVAGLLAQAAAMLTEDHVTVLRAVRSTPDDVRESLLLTPDRFVALRGDVVVVPAQRAQVLADLGWFGVRLGVQALVDDPAMTASRLAPLLREASGIERLRTVLTQQLAARADVLKARSAALVLDQVLARDASGSQAREDLTTRLEAELASAHDYAELRLLSLLRAGVVRLPDTDVLDAGRLLGVGGQTPSARVGLPDEAPSAEIAAAAHDQLTRWRRRAEHPLSDRAIKDAAAVLVRTCEGIVMDSARSTA